MASLKTTVVELTETIEACKAKEKVMGAECKRLQKEMDDFKNNRDSKLKEIKV